MFLKGKSAIVTGSTSGIGLAYAKALAAEGASVMVNGFGDADAIEAERKELEGLSGAKALYDAADMSKPDQIGAMVERCHTELGGPDIVINNAGIQHVSPIEDFPPEKYDAIIAINMSSVWHLCKAAVPHMKRAKWGRIISTASAHSLVASPTRAPMSWPSMALPASPRRWRWRSRVTASPSTASPPAMSGRRWSKTRFPTR